MYRITLLILLITQQSMALDFAELKAAFIRAAEQAQLPGSKPITTVDIPIHFGYIDKPGVNARCISINGIPVEIVVDRGGWDKSSDIKKTIILFHELGHCVLGLSHNNKKIQMSDGHIAQASLMWWQDIEEEDFIKYREYYLQELFAP